MQLTWQPITSKKARAMIPSFPSWRFHLPAHRSLKTPPYLTGLTLGIVLLVLLPLLYLVLRAIGAGQDSLDYLLKSRTLTIISNSVVLVLAVTGSATLIGVPYAWLTARSDLPFRRFWLIVGLLPMVVPSYLAAVTLLAAFGEKGMLQQLLEPIFGITALPEIKGFFGAWLAITLFTYPYILLPVRAALLNADPALEEAGHSMGLNRWQVFRRITLPQLRPALAGGMLLVALYTLSDFGAVAVMRYNAFTRAIEQQVASFRMERAAVLALVLVAFTLILLIMERVIASNKQNYRVGTGCKRDFKMTRLGIWRYPAMLFCVLPVFVGVVVPVLVLLSWVFGKTQVANVPPPDLNGLLMNTGGISLMSAIIIAMLAIAPAMLAIRATSRRSRWLVGLTYTGNILPGIVIALALVYFASNYMLDIYQTLPLLVLGYATRFLPYSIASTRSALTQLNPRYEEAARGLGLPSWKILLKITLPLIWSGIMAGTALVFLSIMKELPATLILHPTGFDSFATRIWAYYEEGFLAYIGQPGLVLMGISALGLVLILWRDRKHVAR